MKTSNPTFKSTITLFALSALLCAGFWWLSTQRATGATLATNPQVALKIPRIPISITIGRASKKCGGFGICKITIGLKAAPAPRVVNGELSRTTDGKLQLRLLEKAPDEGQTLFVDEDITLSPELASKLEIKSGTIQRGAYAFNTRQSLLNARLTR